MGDASTDNYGAPQVSFSQDVHPILTRECTRCHDFSFRADFRTARATFAALSAPDRPVSPDCGETQLSILTPGHPEQSGLYQLVVGWECNGRAYFMPKFDARGPLASFDPVAAETIRQWIEQGALNN